MSREGLFIVSLLPAAPHWSPGLKTTKRKAAVKSLVLLSGARSLYTDVTLLLGCAQ